MSSKDLDDAVLQEVRDEQPWWRASLQDAYSRLRRIVLLEQASGQEPVAELHQQLVVDVDLLRGILEMI